jgi:hypothetical protein
LQPAAAPAIFIDMDSRPGDVELHKAAEQRRLRDIAALTPQERLERFAVLQRRAMELLRASPEGYREFVRRNHRKRAIDAKY